MPFQKQVNVTPNLAIAGDFASSNPRAQVVGGEGASYVAGTGGATVARFGWITGDTVLTTGSGVPDGFIHREMNALITTYLAESGNVIQQGQAVAIFNKGDFYCTATVGAATKGQKAFAKLTDGTVQFAAAGATVSGFIETAWTCVRGCLVNELAVISL